MPRSPAPVPASAAGSWPAAASATAASSARPPGPAARGRPPAFQRRASRTATRPARTAARWREQPHLRRSAAVSQPVSGTEMALATPKLVMTQVPCARAGAQVAGDGRQRHVGDRRIQHVHERGQRQRQRAHRARLARQGRVLVGRGGGGRHGGGGGAERRVGSGGVPWSGRWGRCSRTPSASDGDGGGAGNLMTTAQRVRAGRRGRRAIGRKVVSPHTTRRDRCARGRIVRSVGCSGGAGSARHRPRTDGAIRARLTALPNAASAVPSHSAVVIPSAGHTDRQNATVAAPMA
jgi:hypothetical protein